MRIETERLVIRTIRPEDVAPLASLWADPAVTAFVGGPRDEGEVQRTLEQDARSGVQHRFDLWPVAEKATGHVVGHCGLLEKEIDGKAEIELVFVLASCVWGRGYATEAASAISNYAHMVLGQDRLVSLIEPGHTASARVAEKVGMAYEKDTLRPGGKVMRLYALPIRSADPL